MPYNEKLADRVRMQLQGQRNLAEKRMMGGLTFMVNDKMALGILNDDLMVRLAPEVYEEALERKGCRAMDFTGKPMKGFVFVAPEGTKGAKQLSYWIALALDFNKKKSFNPSFAGTLPAIILIVFACTSKPSDPQPATQVKTILMSGIWKLQSVTVDGADKTPVYNGLTLAFTDTQFNASPTNPIWPASGTWSFTDQSENTIARNDGLQVTITEISSSKLSLKLTWTSTTMSGGRVASLAGVHAFVFGK